MQTGCGIKATAVGEGEVQKRSYPNSGGRNQVCEGYEFVQRSTWRRTPPGWRRKRWRCSRRASARPA